MNYEFSITISYNFFNKYKDYNFQVTIEGF